MEELRRGLDLWRLDFSWTPTQSSVQQKKPYVFHMSEELYPGEGWELPTNTSEVRPTLKAKAVMWGLEIHENWYFLDFDDEPFSYFASVFLNHLSEIIDQDMVHYGLEYATDMYLQGNAYGNVMFAIMTVTSIEAWLEAGREEYNLVMAFPFNRPKVSLFGPLLLKK